MLPTLTVHKNTTHGMRETRLYNIWAQMKGRCNNKNNKDYGRYGGRGICVSDEWNTFENFYDWSVSSGYEDGLTIERVDNNDGYNLHNCKWETKENQNKNKTTTINNRFSLDDLSDMCEFHSNTGGTMGAIASMMGIAKTTVFRILHNKTNLQGA